jgi:carotenoid cleavage dioxygenase-like enzyme
MAERLGMNEFPSCHGGLENLDQEFDYVIDEIEGEVPTDLVGTFLEMVRVASGSARPNTDTGLMAMA